MSDTAGSPRRPPLSEPRLVLLALGAVSLLLACVIGILVTKDAWLVVVTFLAVGLVAGVVVWDFRALIGRSEDAPDAAPPAFAAPIGDRRVIVVASEPIGAEEVLRALDPDGAGEASAVMVVVPGGFGHPAGPSEDTVARANAIQGAMVVGLRAAGVACTGHAGDHDPRRAIDDALGLFPAGRVVVLARGDQLRLYAKTIDAVRLRRSAGVDVEFVDTTPVRA